MKNRLAIATLLLLMIIPAFGQEELLCEWPNDYVTDTDITTLRQDVAQVKDDSASVRRMVEVNNRRLEDLMAREWATTGEVTNLSKFLNYSVTFSRQKINENINRQTGSLAYKQQTIKAELYMLVVASFLFSLVLTNVIHGWRYKELQKQLGIYPRRMPMTPREEELEKQIKKLTKEPKVYAEQPKQSNKWIIMGSSLLLAAIIAGFILVVAALMGVI